MEKLSEESITVDGVPCRGTFGKTETAFAREAGGWDRIETVMLNIAFDQIPNSPGIESRVIRDEEDNRKYVIRAINPVSASGRWELTLLKSDA